MLYKLLRLILRLFLFYLCLYAICGFPESISSLLAFDRAFEDGKPFCLTYICIYYAMLTCAFGIFCRAWKHRPGSYYFMLSTALSLNCTENLMFITLLIYEKRAALSKQFLADEYEASAVEGLLLRIFPLLLLLLEQGGVRIRKTTNPLAFFFAFFSVFYLTVLFSKTAGRGYMASIMQLTSTPAAIFFIIALTCITMVFYSGLIATNRIAYPGVAMMAA